MLLKISLRGLNQVWVAKIIQNSFFFKFQLTHNHVLAL